MEQRLRLVAIGGSTRCGSSAEQALRAVLTEAERLGARTSLLAGGDLLLPPYDPRGPIDDPRAKRLVAEIAAADGLVLASPAYHGGVSGLVKNALDHVEELRGADRPYFTGRAVGCVAVGAGWQGAVSTLAALRDVVCALRGWPVPLGVAINSAESRFGADGRCTDARLQAQLEAVAGQIVGFARMSRHAAAVGDTALAGARG
ncbi:NAD(P)H-dependent oxidoreductase [Kitasatospora cineracea]|uniref:NADPH-dependent FMN reductase n=1 Tax=Kitasatospora cineracea TaxID=88074 RepID=UPI003417D749